MKLGQNFVKYFVRFLGNGDLRTNAFEIYQPLYASVGFSSIDLKVGKSQKHFF